MAEDELHFDGKWEFIKNESGEVKACISQDDVIKLKKILHNSSGVNSGSK